MSKAAKRGSTFGMPILLFILSTAGVISGLIDDGLFDILAWIGLGSAVAAIGWALARRG